MRTRALFLASIVCFAAACSTTNENIAASQRLFEEPPLASRGVETYRLFWLENRRLPIAIIVSRQIGSGPKVELKSTDRGSTYRNSALNNHFIDSMSLEELREFRKSFDQFDQLVSDDDDLVREARESDGAELPEDTLIICGHASYYSIETRTPESSHYISRIACADSFGSDMVFVKPFIEVARKHFNQEFSGFFSFEHYPVLQDSETSLNNE